MPHKDFEADRRIDRGETVTFTLNGEGYEAAADAPGGAILDVAATATDDSLPDGRRAMAIGTFLDAVLLPESAERFADRFRDPTNPITLEQATELLTWLVEEVYVGRPTARSRPSRPGPRATGRSTSGTARIAGSKPPVGSPPATSSPTSTGS